jgi:hypothetical protein
MQETIGGTEGTRRRLTPYLATWILLAVLAGSYIAVAALRPEILTSAGYEKPLLSPLQTNDGQRATTASKDDPLQMQRDILALKQKLAQARDEARLRAAEEEKYKARVAELETGSTTSAAAATDGASEQASSNPSTTATAETSSAPTGLPTKVLNGDGAPEKAITKSDSKPTDSAKKDPASAQNTTTIAKAPAPKPEPTPPVAPKKAEPKPTVKTASKPKAAPAKKAKIETASVDRKAAVIDFGPAVVTTATKPIGVRIATGPSVDSLRLSWSALADRHGPSLTKLTPRYMTGIGATGLTYDLVAGPMSTEAEAQSLCQRLASSGVRCSIGEYTGNAL